jgi:Flp pilus assembly pilin Flp
VIDRIVVWALTLRERARGERGQDVMEYALITGGIAIALIVAILTFTGQFPGLFTSLKNCIDFNNATTCP